MLASLVAGSDPSSVPEFDPALAELPDIRHDATTVCTSSMPPDSSRRWRRGRCERIPERLFGHV